MKNLQFLLLGLMIGFVCSVEANAQKPHPYFEAAQQLGDNLPQNKIDENGNTFLHDLALRCNEFNFSNEIVEEFRNFIITHKGNSPNPLKKNKNNQIALDIATFNNCDQGFESFLAGLMLGYIQGASDNNSEINLD